MEESKVPSAVFHLLHDQVRIFKKVKCVKVSNERPPVFLEMYGVNILYVIKLYFCVLEIPEPPTTSQPENQINLEKLNQVILYSLV
jgi:hypothetical protein